MLKWGWIASLTGKACYGRSVWRSGYVGGHISINIWWAMVAASARVHVFHGSLVIYMCVYKVFHMKNHFKRGFKWGRRSLSPSISGVLFTPCHLIILLTVISCSLSLWKLNKGTRCVGSALSGPPKLILEKLFGSFITSVNIGEQWTQESTTSHNHPLAAFHHPMSCEFMWVYKSHLLCEPTL